MLEHTILVGKIGRGWIHSLVNIAEYFVIKKGYPSNWFYIFDDGIVSIYDT